VNKVAKWKKLDKGGYVDKVAKWIKWICGQSGRVDASKGNYLESINKRERVSFLSIFLEYIEDLF
jgi:hypothetical protein